MRVTIIYNKPEALRYAAAGEVDAEFGVLTAVDAVYAALQESGHNVRKTALDTSVEAAQRVLDRLDSDVVFNLFEGFSGYPETEADIAAYLEYLSIPYTGCNAAALRLGLNKSILKEQLADNGVPVPASILYSGETTTLPYSGYPCIVKPNCDDASHGITSANVVYTVDELQAQIIRMQHDYGYDELIVEQFIDGREFNATVTGNENARVLGISEIVFDLPEGLPNILTYKSKWDTLSEEYRGTKPVCPPIVSESEYEVLSETAVKAFRAAGCNGYARIDMRMDQNGTVYVLEVNPNPDISPDSGAALQACSNGLSYAEFIRQILSLVMVEAT